MLQNTTTNQEQMNSKKAEDQERKRYSNSELEEFKSIILAKIKSAEVERDFYKGVDINENSDGPIGSNEKNVYANANPIGDINPVLAIRQEKYITDLRNALIRIENKTYGICRVTQKRISKERLKVVPHATLSIEAKQKQYKD